MEQVKVVYVFICQTYLSEIDPPHHHTQLVNLSKIPLTDEKVNNFYLFHIVPIIQPLRTIPYTFYVHRNVRAVLDSKWPPDNGMIGCFSGI